MTFKNPFAKLKGKLKFKSKKADRAPSTQKEREERKADRAARAEARHDPKSRFNIAMPYILTALAIFLGLCLYARGCGLAGDVVRFLFLSLFSYASYLFPVILLGYAFFWRREVGKGRLGRRTLLLFVTMLLLLSLVYILTLPRDVIAGNVPKEEILLDGGAYFDYAAPHSVGGGFLGSLVGWILYRLVGPVMTIVLAALAVLLYGIFGFGFSPDTIVTGIIHRAQRLVKRFDERRKLAEIAANEEAERAARERIARATYGRPEIVEVTAPTAPAATAEEQTDAPVAAMTPPAAPTPPRSFADIFEATGGTREGTPPPPPADAAQSAEAMRAYKEKRMRERLRDRDGIHTYAVADLTPKVTAPADEPITPAAPHATEGGNVTHMSAEVLARAAAVEEEPSAPIRGMDDFRRITVTEPVRVYTPHTEPPHATVDAAYELEDEPVTEETEAAPETVATAAVVLENGVPADRTGMSQPEREAPTVKKITAAEKKARDYTYPPITLLRVPVIDNEANQDEIQKNAETLVKTYESFGIPITITGHTRGPRITRYEFVQKAGIRVQKVASFTDDITQKLSTQGVRIEAPIPNKSSIGVEVPNRKPTLVRIRSLIDTDTFRDAESKTTVAVGCDVTGTPVFFDIAKAPHMLIAGATGMGKSVCINTVLISLLYKASPDDVRLILIDPKKVEFGVYSKVPHLLVPVVTDPNKAAGALNWAVNEMERRYDMIEAAGVRDIKGYNAYCQRSGAPTLPKIVIVIDELNDLMMSARKMVEASICRIAQKARAAGIHLLIGTQRPSVNVITGDIKVNIPARIAFRVNQLVDSRTILDMQGAEKLLPNGDMLFSPAGTPQRVQGAFVEDEEVRDVVEHLAASFGEADFDDTILADIEKEAAKCAQKNGDGDDDDEDGDTSNLEGIYDDPKFEQALDIAFSAGSISTSMLQRKIGVGFGRAARFIDAMCEMGIVGEARGGSKPRELLLSRSEYEERRLRLDD